MNNHLKKSQLFMLSIVILILIISLGLNFFLLKDNNVVDFPEAKLNSEPRLKIESEFVIMGPPMYDKTGILGTFRSKLDSMIRENTSKKKVKYVDLISNDQNIPLEGSDEEHLRVIEYDEYSVVLEFKGLGLDPNCYPYRVYTEPCTLVIGKNTMLQMRTMTMDAFTSYKLTFE